jgi:undecaprenyl-diphosphatase
MGLMWHAFPRLWHRLRQLERHELTWLMVGLAACGAIFAFVALAGEVMEGDTRALDTRILLALRNANDLAQPRGPAWLQFAMVDLTALGGSTVLGLVVLAIVGFLILQARYRTAFVIAVTAASGELLNEVMKRLFMRPRPTVVPYLRDVVSTSFPSGHAMQSGIIYLTLGAMLMRIAERPLTKAYCLAVAVSVTALVEISRVYLGVHYPTDVLGGWTLGFAWASLCWLIAQRYDRETGVAGERNEKA